MSRNPTFIQDDGLHRYRTEIPNLIDDLDLSPYAYRLYGRIKRVAGDSGVCWEGMRGLARSCKMGVATAHRARKELIEQGLIRVAEGKKAGDADEIRVVDVWLRNMSKFSPKDAEQAKEFLQNGRSTQEHKKEHIEEEHKESLSNERPKKAELSPTPVAKPRRLKVDDNGAEALWDELLADDANAELLRRFANLRAELNQSGGIKVATIWRQVGEKYAAAKAKLSSAALGHGLSEALSREKSDIRYALAVARSYQPEEERTKRSPRSAQARRRAARKHPVAADYDEEGY